MEVPAIRRRVADYYAGKLREHGATPRGVDWSSAESQTLRFRQLLRVCEDPQPFSINDYGCGYGALVEHLIAGGARFTYCGFDIAASMVECARTLHAHAPFCTFVADETELAPADYTVASGILNVKLDTPDDEWRAYVLDTVGRIAALSRRGFALNALTLYSEPDRRRPDLHYVDPLHLFDHCKRTFSRYVTLLHDYELFEFTILVRRGDL